MIEPIEAKEASINEKNPDILSQSEKKEAVPDLEQEKPVEKVAAEKDETYRSILSKVKTAQSYSPTNDEIEADARSVYNQAGAEGKVQQLVGLAMNKGVFYAVNVARHLENNYVLDVFHDRLLADELHQALAQKGLLKEI